MPNPVAFSMKPGLIGLLHQFDGDRWQLSVASATDPGLGWSVHSTEVPKENAVTAETVVKAIRGMDGLKASVPGFPTPAGGKGDLTFVVAVDAFGKEIKRELTLKAMTEQNSFKVVLAYLLQSSGCDGSALFAKLLSS